jgi:hypothetical protein
MPPCMPWRSSAHTLLQTDFLLENCYVILCLLLHYAVEVEKGFIYSSKCIGYVFWLCATQFIRRELSHHWMPPACLNGVSATSDQTRPVACCASSSRASVNHSRGNRPITNSRSEKSTLVCSYRSWAMYSQPIYVSVTHWWRMHVLVGDRCARQGFRSTFTAQWATRIYRSLLWKGHSSRPTGVSKSAIPEQGQGSMPLQATHWYT